MDIVVVNIFSIIRYQEHGIIQKWYSNLSRDPKVFQEFFDVTEQNSIRQINLVNVSGAFILLCIGLLVSLISFVLELIKSKRDVTRIKETNWQK